MLNDSKRPLTHYFLSNNHDIFIFQEGDFKYLSKLATRFDQVIPSILGGVNEGVKMIKDLIEGKINLNDLVLAFVDSLMQLPKKVFKVTTFGLI